MKGIAFLVGFSLIQLASGAHDAPMRTGKYENILEGNNWQTEEGFEILVFLNDGTGANMGSRTSIPFQWEIRGDDLVITGKSRDHGEPFQDTLRIKDANENVVTFETRYPQDGYRIYRSNLIAKRRGNPAK